MGAALLAATLAALLPTVATLARLLLLLAWLLAATLLSAAALLTALLLLTGTLLVLFGILVRHILSLLAGFVPLMMSTPGPGEGFVGTRIAD
jgi:hypothetical protein